MFKVDGVLSSYQNTTALQVQRKFKDVEYEAKVLNNVMIDKIDVEVGYNTYGFFPYFRFIDERATELKTARNENSQYTQTHRRAVLKGVASGLSEIEGDKFVNGTWPEHDNKSTTTRRSRSGTSSYRLQ